jgi:hypothetical protein
MPQLVFNSNKPHDGWLERKSVNILGRLGSLYDVVNDNIINQYTIPASQTISSVEPHICRTFSGDLSNILINYLKWMDFNIAMEQSILFGMIKPSGVSSLINYNQSINENTRFLYYSYRSKEEELSLIPGKLDRIIPSPSSSTRATHMITKILWGFEILCVIQILDYQRSHKIDSLLRSISNRLKNSGNNFVLTGAEKRHLAQLINVTIYGSETCIDHPNISLVTVLSMLKYWQNHDSFHHPLKYTMCSLRWLYNNKQFPEFFELSDKMNSDIAKVQPIISWLDNWAKYFRSQCEILPTNFSSLTLDQALKDIQERLKIWSITYENFRKHLRKVLFDIRRRCCQSIVIQNVMLNQRYSLLKETEIQAFKKTIQRLLKKAMLIQRLNKDEIQYINVLDLDYHGKIPLTHEHVEDLLRRSLVKEDSCVFIFYSNDRLKHVDLTIWEKLYHRFISKRQQTVQRSTLIYADFTDCPYDLEDLTIVKITMRVSKTLQ